MTTRKPLAMIVGMNANRVIGANGRIPWHSKEDMRCFRRTTIGHAVIMGRLTYESLPKRPLLDRHNIVVSRSITSLPDSEVVSSVEEAISLAHTLDPCPFVIGGAQIYRAALPFATHLYITEIDIKADGDTLFPDISPIEWQIQREQKESNCTFQCWTRRDNEE